MATIWREEASGAESKDIEIRRARDGSFLKTWTQFEEFDGSDWRQLDSVGPKFSERRVCHCNRTISRNEAVALIHRYCVPEEFRTDLIPQEANRQGYHEPDRVTDESEAGRQGPAQLANFIPTSKNYGQEYCDFEDAIPGVVALLQLLSGEIRFGSLSRRVSEAGEDCFASSDRFKSVGIDDIAAHCASALGDALNCFDMSESSGGTDFVRSDAAETIQAASQQAVAALMMVEKAFRSELSLLLKSGDTKERLAFLRGGAFPLSRTVCDQLIQATTKLLEALR